MTRVTKSGGDTPATWLFDFDGTLVDSVELILDSLRYTTRAVLGRVVPDEVLRARVGRPLEEHMRELDAERADDLVAVYREHNMRRHADLLRPYPGVAEMLAGLRGRGVRVGIVTSKMRPAVDAGLALVPLGEFDAIVTCEDTDRHKPDPAPVLRGLELVGGDPETTVYVGDSPYDVQAGRAAGVRTAAALWGAFPAAVLRAERPDRELARPEEALAW